MCRLPQSEVAILFTDCVYVVWFSQQAAGLCFGDAVCLLWGRNVVDALGGVSACLPVVCVIPIKYPLLLRNAASLDVAWRKIALQRSQEDF